MSDQPDYVNDLPPGTPEGAPRCEHEFKGYGEYRDRETRGGHCGLPAEETGPAGLPRCYFHAERDREADEELRARVEAAAAEGRYLAEAHLPGANLEHAGLSKALLPWANLRGASLRYADLRGAHLRFADLQGARLVGAELRGADLASARLPGAHLGGAKLQDAHLLSADLRGAHLFWANLQGANLLSARLEGADLPYADLQGARLVGAALRGADLHETNLQGAILSRANLRGADLADASLQGADLADANLQYADLRAVAIGPLQVVDQETGTGITRNTDLRRADLRGALLTGATLSPQTDLSGARFAAQVGRRWFPLQQGRGMGLRGARRWWRLRDMRWGQYHLSDERCARRAAEWRKTCRLHGWSEDRDPPTFADCATVYRQLKLNYQEFGDYQTAGEFYLREMECKRAQMVKAREPLRRRPLWALMYLVCGYGERPGWTLLWALAMVGLFAFVQGWLGVREGLGAEEQYVLGPGVAWPSWAGLGRWMTAAYFSVVTFTTLGYGDVRSAPGWGRLAAGTEALAGFVLLSLFLVCIVRKFSR